MHDKRRKTADDQFMCKGKMLNSLAEDIERDPKFYYQNLFSKSYIILRNINYEFQKIEFWEFERKVWIDVQPDVGRLAKRKTKTICL
jgi:hypothetical protein